MITYNITANEEGFSVKVVANEPDLLLRLIEAIEHIEYEEDEEDDTEPVNIKKISFGNQIFSKN